VYELNWLKSSFSEEGGNNCVEVAAICPTRVGLRDSKRPDRMVTVDRDAFNALVGRLSSGGLARHG
jgi:Domain of unknown function (DUF397)